MFPSCIIDHFLPAAGYAAARVLQSMGAQVHVIEGRRCCGLPQLNSGERAAAIDMAKAAIEALERVKADRIVVPSSSCAITIARDYPRILFAEPVWAERARRLGDRITAFTPYAAELARQSGVKGRSRDVRATYHDACQSANVLAIHDEPRALLRDVAQVEIVEMAESAVCCGFGGSFSFEYPEVANRVLERKLENIEATGLDCVIADNPGCLTHLRGGFDARRKPVRVRHIAEVLWDALSDV
jgi:Fe-S oxidoreductase